MARPQGAGSVSLPREPPTKPDSRRRDHGRTASVTCSSMRPGFRKNQRALPCTGTPRRIRRSRPPATSASNHERRRAPRGCLHASRPRLRGVGASPGWEHQQTGEGRTPRPRVPNCLRKSAATLNRPTEPPLEVAHFSTSSDLDQPVQPPQSPRKNAGASEAPAQGRPAGGPGRAGDLRVSLTIRTRNSEPRV